MTVRSFAAILLAGASMCISMRAAQEIRFINFPGSEMELIPGYSPEFTQLMTDFAEPDTLSTLSSVMPYLVIVKNNSTAMVRKVTAIWYSGNTNVCTTSLEVKPWGVPPGGSVLLSPCITGGLDTELVAPTPGSSTRAKLRIGSLFDDAISRFLKEWEKKRDISMSLDSVIFQDHSYIGPDHSGRIAAEITERRINRELASELLRRSPSDRSTYLKAVIDNPDAQNADATSELGARYRTASVLMDEVVTAKDDEGLFRRSLENIIYNDAHELHRRQQ